MADMLRVSDKLFLGGRSKELSKLKYRLSSVDVIFSDVDECDFGQEGEMHGPAKQVALDDNIRTSRIISPTYMGWVARTGWKKSRAIISQIADSLAVREENVQENAQKDPSYVHKMLCEMAKRLKYTKTDFESESWQDYVETYLANPAEVKRARAKFTPERVESMAVPGAKDLYSALLTAYTVYITRNVRELVEPFAEYMGIRRIIANSYDKAKDIRVELENAWDHDEGILFRKMLLKEDDPVIAEDVLRTMNNLTNNGRLEYGLTCLLVPNERSLQSVFDINVVGDYEHLVRFLHGKL